MISGQRESVRSGSFSRRTAADMCEPIHFLLQGHDRLRAVAGMMSILADDLWHRGRECYAHAILEFFNDEWPLHLDDEEYSLMPRLLAGGGKGGTARRVQITLEYDHDLIRQAIMDIGEGLCAISAGGLPSLPGTFAVDLIRTEELLRQHVAWEERALYPLARRCLRQPDLAAIWREMMARRELKHLS